MPHALHKTRPSDLNRTRLEPFGILLTGLIDYAGLFPPAKLSMPAAVRNYGEYKRSPFQWMLGRYILPVSRLAEFEEAVSKFPDRETDWRLSVLAGQDLPAELAQLADFNRRHTRPPAMVIASIELKASQPDEILRLHDMIPQEIEVFFELPISGSTEACLRELARCGRKAKVRLGGETPELIPDPAVVAEFLRLCTEANVAFKATAGLHHPIRSLHALTYAQGSPVSTMHGFLNVFLAAAFLRNLSDFVNTIELLTEDSPDAIFFGAESIGWRNHLLTAEQVSLTRERFALSFGSCSFTEPVEDLQTLFPL